MITNLAQKWSQPIKRQRIYNIPTTIRLRPIVDAQIQDLLDQFPHLSMAQIVNDLLEDALRQYNQCFK